MTPQRRRKVIGPNMNKTPQSRRKVIGPNTNKTPQSRRKVIGPNTNKTPQSRRKSTGRNINKTFQKLGRAETFQRRDVQLLLIRIRRYIVCKKYYKITHYNVFKKKN